MVSCFHGFLSFSQAVELHLLCKLNLATRYPRGQSDLDSAQVPEPTSWTQLDWGKSLCPAPDIAPDYPKQGGGVPDLSTAISGPFSGRSHRTAGPKKLHLVQDWQRAHPLKFWIFLDVLPLLLLGFWLEQWPLKCQNASILLKSSVKFSGWSQSLVAVLAIGPQSASPTNVPRATSEYNQERWHSLTYTEVHTHHSAWCVWHMLHTNRRNICLTYRLSSVRAHTYP